MYYCMDMEFVSESRFQTLVLSECITLQIKHLDLLIGVHALNFEATHYFPKT